MFCLLRWRSAYTVVIIWETFLLNLMKSGSALVKRKYVCTIEKVLVTLELTKESPTSR